MSSEKRFEFTKDNIDLYLKEVAKEYRKQAGKKMPAELVLIGGASVLINYGFRNMTTDIDALIQAASAMKDAINRVGDRYDLPHGWLNADFTFGDTPFDYQQAAERLLGILAETFDGKNLEVGHVKFLLDSGRREWIGNLTGTKETAMLRKTEHETEGRKLIVNARVETGPFELQNIVLKAVAEAFADAEITGTQIRTLIPGRPDPTYRYERIV